MLLSVAFTHLFLLLGNGPLYEDIRTQIFFTLLSHIYLKCFQFCFYGQFYNMFFYMLISLGSVPRKEIAERNNTPSSTLLAIIAQIII